MLTDHFCTKIYKNTNLEYVYAQFKSDDLGLITRKFDKVVLACGALQTTALLKRSHELLQSNISDLLGNFLMEHREGYIGIISSYKKDKKRLFKKLSLNNENKAILEFNGIGVAIANSNEISGNAINIHYEIRNIMPRFYFRRLAKQSYTENKLVKIFLLDLLATVEKYFLYILRNLRKLYDLARRIERYSIYIKAEELANKDSRAYLANNSDILAYDHKVSSQTYTLIINDIEVFKNTFKQKFSAKIRLYKGVTNITSVHKFFGPNWHSMGTTRFGTSSEKSICDENLEIYGAKNCFVLSSSIFPSGSNSNPTFTTLALASRLSESEKFNSQIDRF